MRSVKGKAESLPAVVAHPSQRPCAAFGCPEIGSISPSNAGPAPVDSWFCRWHFGESSDKWPEITRQRRLERENAAVEAPAERPEVTPGYIAKVRGELAQFAKSFGRITDHKAWAKKLKAREEAGEYLSDVQRSGWREALRHVEESGA